MDINANEYKLKTPKQSAVIFMYFSLQHVGIENNFQINILPTNVAIQRDKDAKRQNLYVR